MLRCTGLSLRWLLYLRSTGSRHAGFSSCGTWVQELWLAGSRAQAQQLWRTGFIAPRHVGSSRTRARTRVPCIRRRTPNHCTTRECQGCVFLITFFHLFTVAQAMAKVLKFSSDDHSGPQILRGPREDSYLDY